MNKILTLKGNKFTQAKRDASRGPITLPKGAVVKIDKLYRLHEYLENVHEFWENNTIIDGVLISVYYDRIVAKSNRIAGYLDEGGGPNNTIVGARFNEDKTKHIITHYISKDTLKRTINTSKQVKELFEQSFSTGTLTDEQFNETLTFENLNYVTSGLSKTKFKQFLRDAYFVESFAVQAASRENLANSIVSFYDVKEDIIDLLKKINIEVTMDKTLNKSTVFLDGKNLELLFNKAPYLVSMTVEDFSKLTPEDVIASSDKVRASIPAPTNEPVIGVIDTLFDERVYFHKWVEYHDEISSDIRKNEDDYRHGTAVTSLIVDGPNLNPNLDDGCGRFQVRHFGVSLHKGFSSFSIIRKIREIVSQNTDIKVWNLSLGADAEINNNFISAEAGLLDEIQFDYDIIFVIAGTNAKEGDKLPKKIGAPADSLNAIIVSSVDFAKRPVKYLREGVVLSFFIKPDVAYYGGGNGSYINVCQPLGMVQCTGTSYAAPWIARKLTYLIHVIGLNREEAKALLVDSAIGWSGQKTFEERKLIGNGVVPIKIDDILSTPPDEIKFIVSDVSEAYDSYNYNFPVPIVKGKHPYVAKATMAYFPKCSRNQGVDYTNTELNLIFGVLTQNGISPINQDRQNIDDAPGYIKEKSARNIFRKWDNVKHIGEKFTQRKKAKTIKNKDNPQWGMSVKTIERLKKRDGQGIRFGVIVTLKAIDGKNRIDDFINQAQLRGWLVNVLSVETQIELYNKLNEDVTFD